MGMDLALVRFRWPPVEARTKELTVLLEHIGWYDSVYDEELGSQPCIFTSVTPVSLLASALVLYLTLSLLGME
jgi:hypothetical protein